MEFLLTPPQKKKKICGLSHKVGPQPSKKILKKKLFSLMNLDLKESQICHEMMRMMGVAAGP